MNELLPARTPDIGDVDINDLIAVLRVILSYRPERDDAHDRYIAAFAEHELAPLEQYAQRKAHEYHDVVEAAARELDRWPDVTPTTNHVGTVRVVEAEYRRVLRASLLRWIESVVFVERGPRFDL